MQSPHLPPTISHRHHHSSASPSSSSASSSASKSAASTKSELSRASPTRHHATSIYMLRYYHSFAGMVARNLQMIIVLVGLVVTALVQPLFVTFMILLWIGDEAFRSYFLNDIMAMVTLSNPTGTVFELLMKWSTFSFVIAIFCLLICVTGYLKWKDQQGRGILSLVASPDFSNTLKPYFIVYYSAWLLIYWFEITVIFFGYIGKLALMVYGSDTALEVNAEHNFIGLCFLVLFVIMITLADFIVQDIFNLRTTTPEIPECQRQE